jgi:hypothetical protein
MQLAISELVAAIPDGHVQREYITEVCGQGPLHTARKLRADHVGGAETPFLVRFFIHFV